jgi:RNA polymerase sigma-70 factor, ECF subfamily
MDIVSKNTMITFHETYERHAKDVYRYACWLCGNADDADDITSETFARAWAGRDAIRTETVKAYLFAIARNLYLHSYRKRQRQIELSASLADPTPAPDQLAESRLELDRAMQAMQSLPEANRTALLLRVQHELSYEEIARAMQLPLATVKVKIHRARLKLAALQIGGNK